MGRHVAPSPLLTAAGGAVSERRGRRRRLAGAALLWAAVLSATMASAEEVRPPAAYHDWLLRRLAVGLRVDLFRLEESRRSGSNGYDNANLGVNFLGSLWGLDARQSYVPSPFAELRLVRGLAVGVAYDAQRAKTLDWADEDKVRTAGDGDVEIRGIQAWGSWRVRLGRRWTAHAAAGYAHYWSRFLVSPGWAAPGRSFVVEGTDGWVAGLGCRFSLGRHLGVDGDLRHLQVGDVAARAYFGTKRFRSGAFPMRSDSVSVGLVYGF